VVRQHRRILKAIAAKNPEKAEEKITKQMHYLRAQFALAQDEWERRHSAPATDAPAP
jgi:DNA-binding GntR family transcriptional regulator